MIHGPENLGGVPPAGERPPPIEPAQPRPKFWERAFQFLHQVTGMDLFDGLRERLAAFADTEAIRQLGLELEDADRARLMRRVEEFDDIGQLDGLFGEKQVNFLARIVGELEDLPEKLIVKLARKLGLEIPVKPGK